ncbi:Peroxisomal membrane protein PMP27 [Aspergillus melleus]|uniref:Peroxisomal membrane protein PMP27 n=1 Tax=Aspergillus melleus TaxID=138277 RepID=A0ACC3B7F2_9EURO|nr:Peroxisomal membrane protein PMP27 [Aspergillus melleus]
MVAETLVYHPALAHYLRFVATTVGRDKILRTLQYFSRFYAWYLYRTNRPQSSIDPYNAVKKQFGTTRKILRIGKFIEHLKAAAVALDNKGPVDPVLRYLAVGRQLGYAGYLTLDSIQVIDVIGIRKLAAAKRLQENAYRSWLAGLVCSAIASVYTIWRLQEKSKTIDRKEGEGVVEAKKLEK